MNCKDLQNQFSDFLDGELNSSQTSIIKEHLPACPHCRKEWDYFLSTMRMVHEMREIEPPPGILQGIHAKLERPSLWQRFLETVRGFDFSVPLPAAAAIVAVALIGGFLFRNGIIGQSPFYSTKTETAYQDSRTGERQAVQSKVPSSVQLNSKFVNNPPAQSRNPYDTGGGLLPYSSYFHNKSSQDIHSLLSKNPATAPRAVDADVVLTIKDLPPEKLLSLFHSLIAEDRWQVFPYKNNLTLIRVAPETLPSLYHVLARHQVVVIPDSSVISTYPGRKEPVTVALRYK